LLIGCNVGNNQKKSVIQTESDLQLNKPTTLESDSTLISYPNKPKIKIDMISHAWYSKESPNEYETGESFTIKATLDNPAIIYTENKIKLVTSNTGLIYESDECIISSDGYCNINVTIAESANLGEISLAIQSNTNLVSTTKLTFKVVAGNIIFYTEQDIRKGDFASKSPGQSVNQVVDAWCQSYAESKGWKGFSPMSDRYKKKSYKGMILNNPATISGKVYYRFDAQTKVALATDEYLAESLENSIFRTNKAPINVWTGTIQNNWGVIKNCNNWTYNGSLPSISGGTGELETNTKSDRTWFYSGTGRSCAQEEGIYCVSQPN